MHILRENKLFFITLLFFISGILFLAYQDNSLFTSRTAEKDAPGEEIKESASLKIPEPSPNPPDQQETEKRTEPIIYRVQSGDTLSGIAQRYGIDVETILGANDLPDPHRLDVGRELVLLPVKGVLHQIEPRETLASISQRYRVEVESIINANAGLDPAICSPAKKLSFPGPGR